MPNIVYALTNPAMPGLVKIGATNSTNVLERMKSLHSTGVPEPFECVIAWEVEGCPARDVEKILHKVLHQYRLRSRREFFRIASAHAKTLILKIPGKDATPSFQPTLSDAASRLGVSFNTFSRPPLLNQEGLLALSRIFIQALKRGV